MEHIQEIFDHIKKFMDEKGFPPSGRQIAEELKLDYNTVVKPAIDNLINEGKIKFDELKEKIIEILE